MPPQEVLILAMTKMPSGICTAGVTREPDPVTGLRWARPVRDFGTILPGDMTDANGRLVQCGDVVELNLLAPRPNPPHVEDWLTDFVHHQPRLVRRLEGEKRARFFAQYLDRAPEDVLDLAPAGKTALQDPAALRGLVSPAEKPPTRRSPKKNKVELDMDEALFQKLRTWRLEQVRAQEVPPYIIFHDNHLRTIAAQRPVTLEALSELKGIGPRRLARYGVAVIELVHKHLRSPGVSVHD